MLEFLGIPLMPNRCERLPRQNGFPQRHDPIRFAEAHDIFNLDLWLLTHEELRAPQTISPPRSPDCLLTPELSTLLKNPPLDAATGT